LYKRMPKEEPQFRCRTRLYIVVSADDGRAQEEGAVQVARPFLAARSLVRKRASHYRNI
jgi:hypothetical protein